MLLFCQIVLCYEIPYHNFPVCWSIVMMNKLTAFSLFFWAIASDRIHKAAKEINVQDFQGCSKSCQLYQRILGTFRICYV